MGYHLWKSRTTGYRRRGTRSAELRQIYELGLTTKALYEPLQCCRPDDSPDNVLNEMVRLSFDVVGAAEPGHPNPVGYITKSDLEGKSCRDAIRAFSYSELVADSTPIIDLFQTLGTNERLFVLVGTHVHGIVTRADLQKPPTRLVLFGLISLLELHLTFWIRREYPDDSWREVLKPARLEAAAKILELRRLRNEDLSEFNCLQFCDKRELAVRAQVIRDRLALKSKNSAEEFLKTAEGLRDRLAHSAADLVEGDSWHSIAELIKGVETSLAASDNAVDNLPLEEGAESVFATSF